MHGRRSDDRWQIHRAGILNFWYYDDEEFAFSNGKLLLRGANGSGKSVTMQSLIPVLLDGRKGADRLDPFGSRARRMEDYLLGEKDVVDREERTGYLYLEYKRADKPQFMTTGIGLRARRGAEMDFWGFVIHDNRRIGHDLLLYKTEFSAEEGEEQKIPLTRRQLEDELGAGGRVVRTQRDYMELVNRYIFGFESLAVYDELIQLLIQLRTPKLSKDFKPTVIYEILTASLPALSDDELRPLSDTIENMDQIKQQLDQITRDQTSLSRLCKQYDLYNQFVLAEKAEGFRSSVNRRDRLEDLGRELEATLVERRAEKAACERELEALNREREVLQEEEARLKEHDVFKAEQEKQGLEAQHADVWRARSHKESQLSSKRRTESDLEEKTRHCEAEAAEAEGSIKKALETMRTDAADAHYVPSAVSISEFEQDPRPPRDFVLWRKEAGDHLRKLEAVKNVIQEHARKQEKHQEAQFTLGEAQKELDLARNEEHKLGRGFEEAKDALIEAVHDWRKGCGELELANEEIQEISRRLSQLYELYRYAKARAPEEEAYSRRLRALQAEILEVQHAMGVKKQEIDAKEGELSEWRARKEPEPLRRPETVAARRRLAESGIPHLPFFAAVEFRDELPDDMRDRVESAITEMGLLDAIIVPQSFDITGLDSDRIIRPKPQILASTLADFLRPAAIPGSGISERDIADALASILVTNSASDAALESAPAALAEGGAYRIGIIAGSAPKTGRATFIGREARRRFREQTIVRLEAELASIREERLKLESGLQILQARQRQLAADHAAFPADADTLAAFERLGGAKLQVQAHEREVERCNGKVKQTYSSLEEVRGRLRAAAEGLRLERTEDAYDWAIESMKDYMLHLHEVELGHKGLVHNLSLYSEYKERFKSVTADSAELVREISSFGADLDRISLQLEQVRARLAELGVDEIRARVEQVVDRLRAIPDQSQELASRSGSAATAIESVERDIANQARNLSSARLAADAWRRVFLDDERLDLVRLDDSSQRQGHEGQAAETDDAAFADGEAPALDRAKVIRRRLGRLIAKSNLDREVVTGRLNKAFYEEIGNLVEYRPAIEPVLEVELPAPAEDGDAEDAEWEQLKQKSRRLQVLMEYGGKRVSPYFVLNQLDQDIELQQRLLSEKDRELYEEIIMHSVGRIIRERITRAEQWVKRMRELMAERDTSSGLTFDLRLRPRTAQSEDEMDTKDLVDLLRANPSLLKEEDVTMVVRHFRYRIDRAKELLAEGRQGETLHGVIKEVLDYRQWFSFTLYYTRQGERERELTNNAFYKFSGGEKAMAMYIPLLSAAFSRYSEAREDAPYIISLDEAFAGVDENNIRDMFDLLEKLGFDYIMNSASLWGDYDTVSSLSICELVRPRNASFVTCVHYRWDGHARQLLGSVRESEVLEEAAEDALRDARAARDMVAVTAAGK
ncbi:MAG: TIGR02680 family protein [Clostridia bacterium]|nr:TIGR02680 family protein [Clostridia bacterium]